MEKYDLTLHHMPYSRSHRVAWLAAELGILDAITLEHVNLMEGTQYGPAFKRLNKMSAVPTLILTDKSTRQDTVLTESAAICLFLTDTVPDGESLKPAAGNALGAAAYYRWVVFAVASMDPLLWQVQQHEKVLPADARIAKVAARGRKAWAAKVVPALEEGLGEREFLCEPFHEGFTVADVAVGYACFWADSLGMLDESPVLLKYLARLRGRDGFKAAGRKSSL